MKKLKIAFRFIGLFIIGIFMFNTDLKAQISLEPAEPRLCPLMMIEGSYVEPDGKGGSQVVVICSCGPGYC